MSRPTTPNPEEWRRLAPLLDRLLDSPPEARGPLLDELSGGDPARRAELAVLLAECEQDDPRLDRSAAERFALLFAEAPLEVPPLLGERYRIARELGRGGMAVVFLARDEKHGREVAVKVVRPTVAAALGPERFLQEIEIAARLHHPHIVSLFDSGEAGGLLYYVMPYEEGPSLRQRLRNGPLPVAETIRILRDVCHALTHAHQHDVVHRDIKPDNVLLAGRHALVTDFGVAKAMSAAASSAADPSGEGMTLGTPAYMAPEQIQGGQVDHRVDLYAVGVLGYELLAGRPPFEAASHSEVLQAHLHRTPEPLSSRRAEVPAPLEALLMRCLQKRPEDRWASAEALGDQLEQLAVPAKQGSGPGIRNLLAAAALLTLVGGAALWVRGGPGSAAALDPDKVAVIPFRVTGVDSGLRHLGEGIVELLSAKLNGEGGPVAIDSRSALSAWRQETDGREATAEDARRIARRAGAGQALLGSLVSGPDGRLTITASLLGSRGAARPVATLSGPGDSLGFLLEGIVVRLVAREAGVSEQALAALADRSAPVLRAYLWGRAEYRRGRESESLDHFARALELDSTFALAAVDLVVASGQLLGQALGQRTLYQVPGYLSSRPESDHRRFAAAVELAWRYRDKLSPRDRPLADALSTGREPGRGTAKTMLLALERAAADAPDRAETHYLIGTLLLRQGPTLGYTDSRTRAAASFQRALGLDSAYTAPLFGLVECAALAEDSVELRRMGALYLERVRIGPAADYVRWRVAAGTGDATGLAALRRRFDSLATPTLERIVHASQQSGVALADADRAMALVVERAADRVERNLAVMAAHWLAMNRGRPREALRYLRLRSELETTEFGFWTHSVIAALFWDGDRAVGEASARARSEQIARDTLEAALSPALHSELTRSMGQDGLWALLHGDTARATAAIRWLRRDRPLGADLVDVIQASQTGRPDAAAIRARLDSVAREGCCWQDLVAWVNLVLARAYEIAGLEREALQAIRRGTWRSPPQLLTTYLREEGRLAARLGDRAAAIRAYRHYLALRSDPEPELKTEVERIRGELGKLLK